MKDAPEEKDRKRLARHLARGAATLAPSAREGRLLVSAGDRGTASFAAELVDEMVQGDLLHRSGTRLALTEAGRAYARRDARQGAPFLNQHAEFEIRDIERDGIRRAALMNAAESPLSKLAQRRNRKGEPYLSEAEFRAGERLRLDYTRGQIMPRLGANWQAAVAAGRRSGGSGGAAEITDAAIAARQRVEGALGAVGPELAGMLVDICCFLKGLETVEMERGWPIRSAKVMLKTALAALARHYEPAMRAGGQSSILHWGSEDYRPRLTGGSRPYAAKAAASS